MATRLNHSQRLSCTSSLSTNSNQSSHAHAHGNASGEQQQLVTLPRKRRPRAVGEVSITCPTSSVYLNAEPISKLKPEPEPIYQNEAAAISQQRQLQQQLLQQRRLPLHQTVLRVRHVEPGDANRECVLVSSFVGSFRQQPRAEEFTWIEWELNIS